MRLKEKSDRLLHWLSEQRMLWIDFVLFSSIFTLLFYSLFRSTLQVFLFGIGLYMTCSIVYIIIKSLQYVLFMRKEKQRQTKTGAR